MIKKYFPLMVITLIAASCAAPADNYAGNRAGLPQTTSAGSSEISLPKEDINAPVCIDYLDFGDEILPPADKPLTISVFFRARMDINSRLLGKVTIPHAPTIWLREGKWEPNKSVWQFAPITRPAEGVGKIELGGACLNDGTVMATETLPICVGKGPILDRTQELMEFRTTDTIFIQGYNYRSILGLYELTGQQEYLDLVRKWLDQFLSAQLPSGAWDTGYKHIFWADTGSALATLFNFYKYATAQEKERIDAALQKYVDAILITGDSEGKPFVHEDGSLGIGFTDHQDEKKRKSVNKPYTIATGLTGAQIFAGMYYLTGNQQYKNIAVKACDWLLDSMLPNGQIADYVDDWNPGRKDTNWIWHRWPYDVATYAGEGFIAAWTYIDDADFRERLQQRLAEHIEWLLYTQNYDGSWAVKGSGDQKRSHGVVNLLLWYHRHIKKDPRIVRAVQRYYLLALDKQRCQYMNLPRERISSSLMLRALVDIIQPGFDCRRWKD